VEGVSKILIMAALLKLNRMRSTEDVPCQRSPLKYHYHTELTRLHMFMPMVLSFL